MTITVPEIDGEAWQRSWDRQQESYLPDREERFGVLLDTVAAVTGGRTPTVLDLAGGTGSISLRVLRRFPDAHVTLLDIDPVLRAIARASLGERVTHRVADLRDPRWLDALPHREYDAVLTATALHWLPDERLAELYGEIRHALRPGGVFVNADHMPDDGLPGLTERFGIQERRRREAVHAAGGALSWSAWWEAVAADPVLGPLLPERAALFGGEHSAEAFQPASWHAATLRTAGYAEAGLIWRGRRDAAVASVR
ncbi:MAG: class I SAM-dependent methyltransferase [Micromonosporaceae bacterium]